MKLIKLFFMAAMALLSINASAQTADEIIAKYIAAMGGEAKLKSIQTVKSEGSLSTQGMDIPITITRKHNTGMRVDMEIMGTNNYQIFTMDKGWVFMPIQNQTEPMEVPAEQIKSVKSQLDLSGALVDYKAKGYKVEYLGTEKVDGNDAYKLKVDKDGTLQTYFIDSKTNFIVKVLSTANVNGEDIEMENSFSDYQQTADGYWFPYSNTTMQGTIVYSKITVNEAVDDKIFSN